MRRRNGLIDASVMGMLPEVRLNTPILRQDLPSRYCVVACSKHRIARRALPRERFSPLAQGGGEGRAKPVRLCACSSDVNLFRYGENIIDFNAEIPDGA